MPSFQTGAVNGFFIVDSITSSYMPFLYGFRVGTNERNFESSKD